MGFGENSEIMSAGDLIFPPGPAWHAALMKPSPSFIRSLLAAPARLDVVCALTAGPSLPPLLGLILPIATSLVFLLSAGTQG